MKKQQYKIDKIMRKIENYEYVSFDIFDTLIKRDVNHPQDVFVLVKLAYEKRYGEKLENYETIRIEAEKKAKTKFKNGECTYDSIFEEMENRYSEEILKTLKQLELEIEKKVCIKNQDFYPIYEQCVKANKQIIIISDMYLNKDTIEEILSKNGIKEYQKLYVSSEVKYNKHDGSIYPFVLQDLHVNPKQLIHIGDSKRADYLMAIKNGINAILISKALNHLKYYNQKDCKKLNKDEQFNYQIIETFINNHMSQEEDIYFQLGYEILGIILYGYTTWLIEQLQQEKIEQIFFLSREGNLLKKAFDEINTTNIKSNYLYVSRRSTRVPLLKNVQQIEDVFSIVKMRKITDLKSFFSHVGLDICQYKSLLEKYKCKENTNIHDIENRQELFQEVKRDVIENAKEEEKNLVGYLKQESFSGRLAIADVGWEGTMQNALNIITERNNISANLVGFYMGQSKNAKAYIEKGMNTKAYLFDYATNGYQSVRPFLNLFESLFLAQHGTTKKYKLVDKKYQPVLEKCEYTKEEKKLFEKIQKGAMQFIKDYHKKGEDFIKIYPESAFLNMKRLGLNPTLQDVNLFCNISYLETIKATFANPKSFIYYIIHPKKLYVDFCNCSWKVGFLKKLFKLNINYFKLYKLMIKYKG